MKLVINRKLTVLWLTVWAISAGGCASLIDRYDKIAYQNATSIKVDALVVMDKATEPYSQNESSVEELKIQVEKAYEYAKGRPKNEIVTKQWDIMKDPNRNLLGGFLVRWKAKETLSKIFITEAKNNISLGFDQIIGLESGKIKPESGK